VGFWRILVEAFLITDIDPSPIVPRPVDAKGIDMDNNSMKRKNGEVVRPIVPKRPVRVFAGPQNDGSNSGKMTGNNTFPLDLSTKSNQRTQTAPADPGCSKKGKAKFQDESGFLSNRRTSSIEPTTMFSTSAGPFRPSAKLLAQQKTSQDQDMERAKGVTATIQNKSLPLSPLPPARSPPSLPTKDRPLTSTLTYQSPDTSIPDQYGFETPSIFEQALSDVEQLVKEERVLINLPQILLADQVNGDPIKRKSTAYEPPKPSSHVSNAATVSPLGFATTSGSRTTISTDYSDIRDKDVFKGLQIALAAACNKDLDSWIMKMSGCRVRRFLADLRAFEGLGVNTLADQAKRTAKKRREERDQRTKGHKYGYVQDHELAGVQERPKRRERKTGDMATADATARRGLLVAQMLGKREARADETVRERALAMGWRNRSVSAGY
jgi:hypothetical protein